jgi:hypothetical protein
VRDGRLPSLRNQGKSGKNSRYPGHVKASPFARRGGF